MTNIQAIEFFEMKLKNHRIWCGVRKRVSDYIIVTDGAMIFYFADKRIKAEPLSHPEKVVEYITQFENECFPCCEAPTCDYETDEYPIGMSMFQSKYIRIIQQFATKNKMPVYLVRQTEPFKESIFQVGKYRILLMLFKY